MLEAKIRRDQGFSNSSGPVAQQPAIVPVSPVIAEVPASAPMDANVRRQAGEELDVIQQLTQAEEMDRLSNEMALSQAGPNSNSGSAAGNTRKLRVRKPQDDTASIGGTPPLSADPGSGVPAPSGPPIPDPSQSPAVGSTPPADPNSWSSDPSQSPAAGSNPPADPSSWIPDLSESSEPGSKTSTNPQSAGLDKRESGSIQAAPNSPDNGASGVSSSIAGPGQASPGISTGSGQTAGNSPDNGSPSTSPSGPSSGNNPGSSPLNGAMLHPVLWPVTAPIVTMLHSVRGE